MNQYEIPQPPGGPVIDLSDSKVPSVMDQDIIPQPPGGPTIMSDVKTQDDLINIISAEFMKHTSKNNIRVDGNVIHSLSAEQNVTGLSYLAMKIIIQVGSLDVSQAYDYLAYMREEETPLTYDQVMQNNVHRDFHHTYQVNIENLDINEIQKLVQSHLMYNPLHGDTSNPYGCDIFDFSDLTPEQLTDHDEIEDAIDNWRDNIVDCGDSSCCHMGCCCGYGETSVICAFDKPRF